MNQKLILILALVVSISALGVSLYVYWQNTQGESLPPGVKEIEIKKAEKVKVTFDSRDYYFSLDYFVDYSNVIQVKCEIGSGYQIRKMYFTKYSTFYELKAILKERLSNSIIMWIEKPE